MNFSIFAFLGIIGCFGNFDNHLLSGKLVIVNKGVCNVECQNVVNRISKVTSEYYLTNILQDANAKNYVDVLKYKGEFPIFFFKGIFLSDVGHNPELSSILKGL